MKILRGNLIETRYDFPDSDKAQPMRMISERTYKENEVAYMADELGLHKMQNNDDDYAISLHCRYPFPPSQPCKQGCVVALEADPTTKYIPHRMLPNRAAILSTRSPAKGVMFPSVAITPNTSSS